MTTTTTTKTKTCDRCGATGLTWQKSKAGKYYLAERVRTRGYTGRSFYSIRPHHVACVALPALNTSAQERHDYPHKVVGTPVTVIENPRTHVCTWHDWQPQVASLVHGGYCFGCNTLQID